MAIPVVPDAARPTPWARFDEAPTAAAAGGSWEFRGYLGEIVAWRLDEVPVALAAAESAAAGGQWVAGFVTYEAAPGLDPALVVRPPPLDSPPLVWFGRFQERSPGPDPAPRGTTDDDGADDDGADDDGADDDGADDDGADDDGADDDGADDDGADDDGADDDGAGAGWVLGADADSHRDRVNRVRSHIGAGDTYQLNLTDRWRSPAPDDPLALYRRLLEAQRPARGVLIDTGRWVVASASPELFFHWHDGVVACRPMKGTAARGRWSEEDRAVGVALAGSAKDRAENVMIVDLVRNDLGRVAEYGSVAVTDLWRLERYPTLWQLTSGVTATARPGTTLVELFRALFPCGSITGAPKARTMQLITEVEGDCRGVYCGAIGFVGPAGPGGRQHGPASAPSIEAWFNVAIRTVVIDTDSGQASYGTGGGIVWDSDPGQEFAESRAKAEVLVAPHRSFDLIETMAFAPGHGVRNRSRHLDRLAASADYFDYPLCRPAVDDLLDATISGRGEPTRIRLSLSRSGQATLDCAPLPDWSGAAPVRLAIDDHPVDSTEALLFHKTTLRRPYTERLARHGDVDDVVLVNERGEATETTIANLAVLIDGAWCTPPLAAGCLPGIERGRRLDDATLIERTITVVDLRAAPQVAVISSLRGWRPAVVVGERRPR